MPHFKTDDLNIRPDEYLRACTKGELTDVIDWLYDHKEIKEEPEVEITANAFMEYSSEADKKEAIEWLYTNGYDLMSPKMADSLRGKMFGDTLVVLFDKQHLLSPEELEIIEKIGEKFK